SSRGPPSPRRRRWPRRKPRPDRSSCASEESMRIRTASLASLTLVAWLAHAAGFKLESPTIKPGSKLSDAQVYNGFGCTGKNVSPALKWSGAPKDAKSFALTVYDPDAPTGSGWWHWVVYNIPADVKELAEGAGTIEGKGLHAGSMQAKTDLSAPGLGRDCRSPGGKPPPSILRVYARR